MTKVSIVISTRNRCDDLVVAVESCLAQQYPSLEVLVYDDASDDETAETIAREFPEVQLHTSSTREGYLVWRNQGFRDASGAIVVSIDDDAYFTDSQTVSRIVELFEEHSDAGALALPYVEPHRPSDYSWMPDLPSGSQLRSYTGCAHAVRRELVVEMGGYPEFLIHQGEERHLCLRLLDRGWRTLFADTSPIVHMFSPNRDRDRVDYYGYRNTLLFTGMLAPSRYLIPRLLVDSAQLLRHQFRFATIPRRLNAIGAGWMSIWKYRRHRSPVSRETYTAFRGCPGHGPMSSPRNLHPLTRKVAKCMS